MHTNQFSDRDAGVMRPTLWVLTIVLLPVIWWNLFTTQNDSTSTIASFSNATILSTSYPGYGWLMVVSINVPNGVEGEYYIAWEGERFICSMPEQHTDQLDCIVPLLPPWEEATFTVYPADSETGVFQFICANSTCTPYELDTQAALNRAKERQLSICSISPSAQDG